jgi:hypothetical protein
MGILPVPVLARINKQAEGEYFEGDSSVEGDSSDFRLASA